MNIMPTLEGGLRIDAETTGDWRLLSAITNDAVSCSEKLGERLGGLITDEELAHDWREYIIEDLDAGFHADVLHVTTAIAAARVESGGGPGPLWISRDDGIHWYSALNQARLALEEEFHFGESGEVEPGKLPAVERAAFFRSQFYCAIQSLLLDHVMT